MQCNVISTNKVALYKRHRTKFGRPKNHDVFTLVCNSAWCCYKIHDQRSWNHGYLTGSRLASDNAVLNCCFVMQDHFYRASIPTMPIFVQAQLKLFEISEKDRQINQTRKKLNRHYMYVQCESKNPPWGYLIFFNFPETVKNF